ncbi:hypothetical protein [Hyphomicrobium sp.]|uniref:hypothetical protein n=1 Tax=Hyphomicrobium sp. TaxID=82 RepID=UPI001DC30118|nr:hypothetical protein [Hyphomicrobium sp.]MBY0559911.1 hypothetical protein [Hyphomicrobium sp.]
MKHAIVILGWFFTYYQYDLNSHAISVGPFSTSLECEDARAAMATHQRTSLTCWER